MEKSDASAAWDDYFASEFGGLTDFTGLRDQLDELEDDVFDDESRVSISDIAGGKVTTATVTSEDEFDANFVRRPLNGVRIISISSSRTISPLRITSSLAARIFKTHRIKREFLRVLLSFGNEPHQSEASSGNFVYHPSENGGFVTLYKFNYVESNRRKGKDPWSFRHVGVYHERRAGHDLLVVVHCTESTALVQRLRSILGGSEPQALVNLVAEPTRIHQLVASSYAENWRPYLRYLGELFTDINNEAMVVSAEQASEDSFRRVQSLRHVNDVAMFAQACCNSNLGIIRGLSAVRVAAPGRPMGESEALSSILVALQGYVDSTLVLQNRIRNTIDLVGYTLNLRNQLETTKVDREIRDMTAQMEVLARRTAVVTQKLQELTQDSVDDSAIGTIITIVSAIYLPGSFVGTFFGMNFFGFNDASRKIDGSTDIWIFIVAWASLTILTGSIFFFTYRRKKTNKKQEAAAVRDPEKLRQGSA